ncbi:uncharacterized protein LOC130614598 [Hydractinia symbiolongicarpus]|uniref:uncharacterized protein LOC130614598 n=1 Tax=Hydractinia symbiolongicarpus TaxID=13093 RepID=UPI00254F0A1F|nr:uncharacterized protein LOC130614598 [Hydractinia symbiolongicarpus]
MNVTLGEPDYAHTELNIILIPIIIISLFCNLLGIYLLKQQKPQHRTNQRLIMISMSLGGAISACVDIVSTLGYIFGLSEDALSVCLYLSTGMAVTYYSILLILTWDRLLACVFLLRYRSFVTTIKVSVALLILGGIAAIQFFFIGTVIFYSRWNKYVYLFIDGIVLLTVFTTYIYIVCITTTKRRPANSNPRRNLEKNIVVTSIIVFTFLLLVAVPDALYVYRFSIFKIEGKMVEGIVPICWQINYIIDPFVYIFLQKDIRETFRCKIIILRRKTSCLQTHSSKRRQHGNQCFAPSIIEEAKVHHNITLYDTNI